FSNKVLIWWNTMQPEWRVLEQGALDKGEWGQLKCPGINGLYSMMACLRWWAVREISEGGKLSEKWKGLLGDFVWVMDSIAADEEQPLLRNLDPLLDCF
ncbi:hypothetical protein K435DRAFT_651832, partial [Dendrothele bispora CBS 962.96]